MERKSDYNAGVSVQALIDQLPPGLDRALLRVLSYHVGREKAISRGDLVVALAQHGFFVHERAARAAINLLRKQGYMICSTGGEDGGYWIGKSKEEVNEYIDRELTSRIVDLAETKTAILHSVDEKWGEGRQERLF